MYKVNFKKNFLMKYKITKAFKSIKTKWKIKILKSKSDNKSIILRICSTLLMVIKTNINHKNSYLWISGFQIIHLSGRHRVHILQIKQIIFIFKQTQKNIKIRLLILINFPLLMAIKNKHWIHNAMLIQINK